MVENNIFISSVRLIFLLIVKAFYLRFTLKFSSLRSKIISVHFFCQSFIFLLIVKAFYLRFTLKLSSLRHMWPSPILAILFSPFGFIGPKTLNHLSFQSLNFEHTWWKVIPETHRAHKIWYLRFYLTHHGY